MIRDLIKNNFCLISSLFLKKRSPKANNWKANDGSNDRKCRRKLIENRAGRVTHLTVSLMFEGGNLLDCHFLLSCRVPGLHHGTVGSLAQELDRFVPRSNLADARIKLWLQVGKIKCFYG